MDINCYQKWAERTQKNSIVLQNWIKLWKQHVNQFLAQAPHELALIYKQITKEKHVRNTSVTCTKPIVMVDNDTNQILIGQSPKSENIYDICIFVNKQHFIPYPFHKQELWPWTACKKQIPLLPKNIWILICSHLPPAHVFKLGEVSKSFYQLVQLDRVWQPHVQMYLSLFPNLQHMAKKYKPSFHFMQKLRIPDRNGLVAKHVAKWAFENNLLGTMVLANFPWKRVYNIAKCHLVTHKEPIRNGSKRQRIERLVRVQLHHCKKPFEIVLHWKYNNSIVDHFEWDIYEVNSKRLLKISSVLYPWRYLYHYASPICVTPDLLFSKTSICRSWNMEQEYME